MRRKLIILANSRKMGNRCIAGIDESTDEWIRPCFGMDSTGIPWQIRNIDGEEPQLLDIISISLTEDGPHRDIQPENRSLLEGAWEKVSETTVEQVDKYCQQEGLILYNLSRRIHVSELPDYTNQNHKSLCIVRADVAFHTEGTRQRKKRVVASFGHGDYKYDLPVTDYDYELKFPAYEKRQAECLLAISLGLPFEQDNYCYKFVVGVIEI